MTDLRAIIQIKQNRLEELNAEVKKLSEEIKILQGAAGILSRERSGLSLTDRYTDFSEFLSEICNVLHSTKGKIFETIGIDQSCYYNWVKGITLPSTKAKSRFANGVATLTNNDYDAKAIMEAMDLWFKAEEKENATDETK